MAKYTTPETVELNLRQAYDDHYYASVRHKIRFVLGSTSRMPSSPISTSLTGDVPDDVDLLPNQDEMGRSRRILVNSSLMAAKITHVEPDPTYPDKSRWKDLMTRAVNRAIWRGRPHMGPTKFDEYGEMQAECQRAFMDFDNLGMGFVQIGIRDGWTCVQHHPLSRVIWDRHRLGFSRARYVALVHYLAEEEAIAMFGSSIKDDLKSRSVGNESMRTLKAIQYFDMGIGTANPTEMWRLNTFQGRVLDVSENEYGCLPVAHGEFMHFWGMRRPMGRIDFQIADQKLRNALERYQRLILERGPGFDAIDMSNIDPDDAERIESGELLPTVRFNLGPMGKIGDVIERFSPHNPPEGLFRLKDDLDRSDPGQSGISDGDRANVTSSPRTLGEVELAQTGADTQKAWSQRQYAKFLERVFYKINYIAAKHHTAPTQVAINGVPYLLNDPAVPQTNLQYWLTPHAWPMINEDALAKESPIRKMQIAQGKWTLWLSDPFANPIEVRKAMLEEMGEKDVDRFLNPQAIAQYQQMAQGGMQPDAMALTGGQDMAAPPM